MKKFGRKKICVICSGDNVKSASDKTESSRLQKILLECMELSQQNGDDVTTDIANFCMKCKTVLEHWKFNYDQEIKFRQCRQRLNAILVPYFLKSKSPDNVKVDTLVGRIQRHLKKQYEVAVVLPRIQIEIPADKPKGTDSSTEECVQAVDTIDSAEVVDVADDDADIEIIGIGGQAEAPTMSLHFEVRGGRLTCRRCSVVFEWSRSLLSLRDHCERVHGVGSRNHENVATETLEASNAESATAETMKPSNSETVALQTMESTDHEMVATEAASVNGPGEQLERGDDVEFLCEVPAGSGVASVRQVLDMEVALEAVVEIVEAEFGDILGDSLGNINFDEENFNSNESEGTSTNCGTADANGVGDASEPVIIDLVSGSEISEGNLCDRCGCMVNLNEDEASYTNHRSCGESTSYASVISSALEQCSGPSSSCSSPIVVSCGPQVFNDEITAADNPPAPSRSEITAIYSPQIAPNGDLVTAYCDPQAALSTDPASSEGPPTVPTSPIAGANSPHAEPSGPVESTIPLPPSTSGPAQSPTVPVPTSVPEGSHTEHPLSPSWNIRAEDALAAAAQVSLPFGASTSSAFYFPSTQASMTTNMPQFFGPNEANGLPNVQPNLNILGSDHTTPGQPLRRVQVGDTTYKYGNFFVEVLAGEHICLTCSQIYAGANPASGMMRHIRDRHMGIEEKPKYVKETRPGQYLYMKRFPISKTQDGGLSCGLCNFTVENTGQQQHSRWQMIRDHIRKEHFVGDEDEALGLQQKQLEQYTFKGVTVTVSNRSHSCGACPSTFGGERAKGNCLKHISTVHNSRGSTRPVGRPPVKPKKALQVKKSVNPQRKASVQASSGTKHSLTCGLCGKGFGGSYANAKFSFTRHVYSVHAGLTKWSQAVTQVSQNEYLYMNKVSFSLRDGCYKCGDCGKTTVGPGARRSIIFHLAHQHAGLSR